jgi:hypothetical protein
VPSFSPNPVESVEPTLNPEPTPVSEPTQSESPSPEPVVTPSVTPEPTLEPVQEVVQVPNTAEELIANLAPGEAVSFEDFQASGLDYADLPPNTPITLENGVILTAEVADAIEIFDTPAELISTIFSDPGKALKALRHVGADMTEEERETSQNTVVAAVIVTQLAQVRRIK